MVVLTGRWVIKVARFDCETGGEVHLVIKEINGSVALPTVTVSVTLNSTDRMPPRTKKASPIRTVRYARRNARSRYEWKGNGT